VENLLSRRTFRGYSPHKAKGPVVAALATYYGKTQFALSDYRLTISVNGKEVKKAEVRSQQPTILVHVPTKNIKSGENRIEFHLEGRGSYTYTATLSGFSPELKDPESWDKPHIRSRKYYHAPLEYKGRQIASSTSQITQLEEGQRTYVTVDIREGGRDSYIVVHEYIPAGTMLVDGSISGQYQHYEVGDGVITFYYPPVTYMRDYQYQLVSYASGTYRALPSVVQDTMRPGDMRMGQPTTLTVLAPGEKSIDEYKMNNGELYGMGKAYFDDGVYDEALDYLSKLYERSPTYQQKETARMLLWIHTEDVYYESEKVVQYFEVLRERFPELYIPFNKILVVGRAYCDMEEYERAYLVYKATIDASFINDSNVSAVLEDEGQFLSSIDFQEDLWREYPDSPQVTSSYFALSQAIYSKVPEVMELSRTERNVPLLKGQSESEPKKISRLDLLKETVIMLSQFLTLYPDDPLADDATFSLANALLDLEDFTSVVTLCQTAQKRYLESEYLTSFQYVEALGFFSQRKYDEAVDAATIVADGKSKDRDLARYILGQIYHARGKPNMAIDWYGKVKGIYPDAQESISYFQEKRVSLDEVKVVRPDKDAKITIKYRNIKEVAVQVYRVDLMKLYLREKDLSKIRSVQLAGISPQFSKTTTLGDGKDYVDKEHEMGLDLEGEGAYLVICRGDDLFSSGLVLITPLDIEVQEDAVSGRVRVNVRDVAENTYREGVHVKAVGSAEKTFRSGETDLRGLFIADDIRGKATVIAREGKNLYAFYRGKQWLGPREEAQQVQEVWHRVPEKQGKANYRANIDVMNEFIQGANFQQFDQMRRGGRKGVQVQMAE
ncbi:tol-pal system YbgF family protein, partial [Candidatus Poribacteria bacterium]